MVTDAWNAPCVCRKCSRNQPDSASGRFPWVHRCMHAVRQRSCSYRVWKKAHFTGILDGRPGYHVQLFNWRTRTGSIRSSVKPPQEWSTTVFCVVRSHPHYLDTTPNLYCRGRGVEGTPRSFRYRHPIAATRSSSGCEACSFTEPAFLSRRG